MGTEGLRGEQTDGCTGEHQPAGSCHSSDHQQRGNNLTKIRQDLENEDKNNLGSKRRRNLPKGCPGNMSEAIVQHLLFLLVIRNQHNLGISDSSQRIWHPVRKVLTYLFVPVPNPVNSGGFVCHQCIAKIARLFTALPPQNHQNKNGFFMSFGSSCHVYKIQTCWVSLTYGQNNLGYFLKYNLLLRHIYCARAMEGKMMQNESVFSSKGDNKTYLILINTETLCWV